MKCKLKTVLASVFLIVAIAAPAQASYYKYGKNGDYVGKLDLTMNGSTRWGTAGTYIDGDRFIVNTITAEIKDNGRSVAHAKNSMASRATTKTVVCHNNGIQGIHTIVSPSNGNWSDVT